MAMFRIVSVSVSVSIISIWKLASCCFQVFLFLPPFRCVWLLKKLFHQSVHTISVSFAIRIHCNCALNFAHREHSRAHKMSASHATGTHMMISTVHFVPFFLWIDNLRRVINIAKNSNHMVKAIRWFANSNVTRSRQGFLNRFSQTYWFISIDSFTSNSLKYSVWTRADFNHKAFSTYNWFSCTFHWVFGSERRTMK